MSSKTISIGLTSGSRRRRAAGGRAAAPAGRPPGPARSRPGSSGTDRGTDPRRTSARAASDRRGRLDVSSVRWLVLNTRNVPSGLHDSTLVLAFGIALTARLSPPAAGTRYAFRNDRVLRPRYATHLLSADHARLRGDALMKPVRDHALLLRRQIHHDAATCRRARTRACCPSGENFGASSPFASLVSCVSVLVPKSYMKM